MPWFEQKAKPYLGKSLKFRENNKKRSSIGGTLGVRCELSGVFGEHSFGEMLMHSKKFWVGPGALEVQGLGLLRSGRNEGKG